MSKGSVDSTLGQLLHISRHLGLRGSDRAGKITCRFGVLPRHAVGHLRQRCRGSVQRLVEVCGGSLLGGLHFREAVGEVKEADTLCAFVANLQGCAETEIPADQMWLWTVWLLP